MVKSPLSLQVLGHRLAVCRLDGAARPPDWALGCPFFSLTRTAEELSVVCSEEAVPPCISSESGWRCMQVQGPLDFSLTGVLASLVAPLAEAEIAVFALSTYDTDYLLVRQSQLDGAVRALVGTGHEVRRLDLATHDDDELTLE